MIPQLVELFMQGLRGGERRWRVLRLRSHGKDSSAAQRRQEFLVVVQCRDESTAGSEMALLQHQRPGSPVGQGATLTLPAPL